MQAKNCSYTLACAVLSTNNDRAETHFLLISVQKVIISGLQTPYVSPGNVHVEPAGKRCGYGRHNSPLSQQTHGWSLSLQLTRG